MKGTNHLAVKYHDQIVGNMGMGALEYEPELWKETKANVLDFDRLAKECERILKEKDSRIWICCFKWGAL